MEEFIKYLEALRQEIPDPFEMGNGTSEFYDHPVAKKLIAGKQTTIISILDYLRENPAPSLVIGAVLLISYFDPEEFYTKLLVILKSAERSVVEAFEHGFWHIKKEEEKLAGDLVNMAEENPNLLLLLQRPVVRFFKKDLQTFIESKSMPVSLFSMYCYRYALEKDDTVFLEKLSGWKDLPEIAGQAEDYLRLIQMKIHQDQQE